MGTLALRSSNAENIDNNSDGLTASKPGKAARPGIMHPMFKYTQNSGIQSQAIRIFKPILQQEINTLSLNLLSQGRRRVHVADLGCSTGANTLAYAQLITKAVVDTWRSSSSEEETDDPDVQYFFSDLPSSDFNTLFQQLADQHEDMMAMMGMGELRKQKRKFYACAVPGSFYGRLFPDQSLDIVISTFSLHWISQVPDAVTDRGSLAYNKGMKLIDGAKPEIVQAFKQASQHDLRTFLECRAEEVVSGGMMFLVLVGRPGEPHEPEETQRAESAQNRGPCSRFFEETWNEMVAEGIIDEDTMDSFNVPMYFYSPIEIKEALDATNFFLVKRLEVAKHPIMPESEENALRANPEAYGQFFKNWTMSVTWLLVAAHIGEQKATHFFNLFQRRASIAMMENRNIQKFSFDLVSAILIRK